VVTGLAAGEHDITLVLDFLNTIDIETGTDVLDDAANWGRWARSRQLGEGGPARQARAVRDALRASVGDPRPVPEAGDVAATIHVRLDRGGPTLAPVDPLGAVLASATRLAVLGDWGRIKICPADDCHWAFFDRSRNRSRTWCSMRVCGNREKARVWRERARAAVPS